MPDRVDQPAYCQHYPSFPAEQEDNEKGEDKMVFEQRERKAQSRQRKQLFPPEEERKNQE